MTEQAFDTEVAIIGYGPSGVAAANSLGSRGVRAIAFERNKDIYGRARAVTMNDVTLRSFQSVGIADALVADMDETYALRTKTYSGEEFNRVVFPRRGPLGYATSYSIYQPVMEQTMRDGAARHADHVEVRYGIEVTTIEQDANGVTITLKDIASGELSTVRARYALACDGGSSGVREQLGIELLGDTLETRWVIIDAFVKRWWPDRHVLTFWSDKLRPAVDIALSLGTHRWELPLQPGEDESSFDTHEKLWALLESFGVSREDVELHQHAFYYHHVRRAERWREGRIFLIGDAAHLMPPWAGQGMQSGIRDSFNLCWKLAEVLYGRMPDAVLSTYEPERWPDVERYTRLSFELGRIVKQELSEEEMAAMAPKPGEAPPEPPLLVHPKLVAGWVRGDTGDDSIVGKYIPQPRMITTNGKILLLDVAIGNGFTLLGDNVDPRDVLSESQRAAWDALGATCRAVRSPENGSEGVDDLIDFEQVIVPWMRRYGAKVIALRPDRFVAASDTGGLDLPTA
ncbi:bifunctional 3-(3-hydroxy-phenyl)propionate/3-hydroxycinnamic acid hydroxylase [Novosphingobium sp.]|uniref:bifunctional 3-(3-hydroxy-phenyl)propionate/3-hydroxycinnamic acid hydroxylase n=1 Tax=Novosphingobium sp. TaxID=1874826 RepID=UPI002620E51A|nr:bifunctional 3-(3-hydroxy-phenyl)propionate/3-hydroxycinnamic acid hydroxylase [Novosphingobium sp.]